MTLHMLDALCAHLKAQSFRKLANPLFLLFNQNASQLSWPVFLWRASKKRPVCLLVHSGFSV